MSKNLLPISKNGLPKIAYAILFLLLTLILDLELLSFLALVVTAVLVYIYRNPEREQAVFEANSVVSPVDGRVLSIESLEESAFGYKLVIESRWSDVGVLRTPITSTIKKVQHRYGTKLSAKETLSSKLNEQSSVTFEDDSSNVLMVEHLSKQNFDDILLDVHSAQKLSQSVRYGFIANGITTLYLPSNFRVNLSVGSEVIASQTLVGYFS